MNLARATLLLSRNALGLVASTGCTTTCGCLVANAVAPPVEPDGVATTKPVVAAAKPAVTPTGPASAVPRAPLPDFPTPPGAANVPRPSGAPGNLKVLDWAGFTSAVSYTFDDGQPSQIEHYDDLAATGVRLTFFINSAGASWEADFVSTFSRAVRDGHEIGNHTVHHCHADPDGTLYSGTGTQRAACAGASAAAEFDDCTTFITGEARRAAGLDVGLAVRRRRLRRRGDGALFPEPRSRTRHRRAQRRDRSVQPADLGTRRARRRRQVRRRGRPRARRPPLGHHAAAQPGADQLPLVRHRRRRGGHRQHRARQVAGRRLDRFAGECGGLLARPEAPRGDATGRLGRRADLHLDLEAARALPARHATCACASTAARSRRTARRSPGTATATTRSRSTPESLTLAP